MAEIILINVAGHDNPGVTTELTGIMAQYGIEILDIGQSVIHDHLNWGILTRMPVDKQVSNVLKDLLFRCYAVGLTVSFEPVSEKDYNELVTSTDKNRYIVTLLARMITAEQIARVSEITTKNGLNIDKISRLSNLVRMDEPTENQKSCVEFSVRGTPQNIDNLRASFLHISSELNVDIAFQEDNLFRRNRRLVVFDMDSTLIEAEVIDELAKEAGVGEEVSKITELAMSGEIDFNESFKRRVALLEGLDESVLEIIAARLNLTEGAEKLIKTLREMGFKTAILSGGFKYFANNLKQKLGIDYVFANELEIVNGKVTGRVTGQIVDGARKAQLLIEIAEKENIKNEQVIAVGDGANDLPMLSQAGLGIAFRAKPVVKETAKHSISTLGLDGILYLMGLRDRELI